MAEEGLIIDVDYNITKAETKQRKLNRDMEISKQKAKNISNEIANIEKNIEESARKQKEYSEELDRSTSKLEEYRKGDLYLTDKQISAEIRHNNQIQNKLEKEEAHQERLEKNLNNQKVSLQKQNSETIKIGGQIVANSKKQNKFSQALKNSEKSAQRLGSRIKRVIASVLLISIISKFLTKLKEQFSDLMNETGTKTADLIAQLRGNFAIMGRTIYESLSPALEYVLEMLVQMTNIITYGLATMLGKSVKEMQNLAKNTKKAGEEAKKATAGFDTLQTIDTSSSNNADSESGIRFDAIEGGIKNEIAVLMLIIGSATLVLGVVLTFTGTNIPLGLGLIALGAVGLATTASASWDTLPNHIKTVITIITGILSAAFLVIGIILVCTGVALPLGIGFILLGAAGLVTTAAMTWSLLPEKIKTVISNILLIGSPLFILLGLSMLFVNIPMALALIGLGVGSIATGIINSPGDTFVEKVKNLTERVKNIVKGFIIWFSENVLKGILGSDFNVVIDKTREITIGLLEDIISFFENVFSGRWKEAATNILNVFIGLINSYLSNMAFSTQSLFSIGAKIVNGIAALTGSELRIDVGNIPVPSIPKLATGAILPGGSPMLAWVNDQPKGQPYLEGSIDNIAAAFEKYLGGNSFGPQNVNIRFTGTLAQLAQVLAPEISAENNRASAFAKG